VTGRFCRDCPPNILPFYVSVNPSAVLFTIECIKRVATSYLLPSGESFSCIVCDHDSCCTIALLTMTRVICRRERECLFIMPIPDNETRKQLSSVRSFIAARRMLKRGLCCRAVSLRHVRVLCRNGLRYDHSCRGMRIGKHTQAFDRPVPFSVILSDLE